MKIAFFTDTYIPHVSGVVTSIELFRKQLERMGHSVYVFAPVIREEGIKYKSKDKVIRFESLDQGIVPEFPMALPGIAKVLSNFKKEKFDMIHSHTPFMMGMYATIFGATFNLPMVHTYHTFYEKYTGHSIFSSQEKVDEAVMKLAKRISLVHCNRSDLILAPSEKMRKVLEDKYHIKTRVKVLGTGVDLDNYKNISAAGFREKYKLKPDDFVMLYVGRLSKEKNLHEMIQIVGKLVNKNNRIKLLLVGSGPYESEIKLLCEKLDISNNVVFTGVLDKNEVKKAYLASNLFCFTSLTDTQSIVLLEAAASNLPIIMLRDNGLTGVVRNNKNGFVVNNIDEFVSSAEKLVQDDELYQKMSVMSNKIVQDFTIRKSVIKLLSYYEEVINSYQNFSVRKRVKERWKEDIISFKKEMKWIRDKYGVSKRRLGYFYERSKKFFTNN